jgi:hypothetical protein
VFPSVTRASILRYAAMFRLVLGCLISDTHYGCEFRAAEIRNLILYSLGVLFILICFYAKSKEWTTDSMRSALQAVMTRNWVSLKNFLVRVLYLMSSRIWIVTRNSFLYIRTKLDVNLRWKLCDYFAHIHVLNTVTCRVVRVTKIMGYSSDDWTLITINTALSMIYTIYNHSILIFSVYFH